MDGFTGDDRVVDIVRYIVFRNIYRPVARYRYISVEFSARYRIFFAVRRHRTTFEVIPLGGYIGGKSVVRSVSVVYVVFVAKVYVFVIDSIVIYTIKRRKQTSLRGAYFARIILYRLSRDFGNISRVVIFGYCGISITTRRSHITDTDEITFQVRFLYIDERTFYLIAARHGVSRYLLGRIGKIDHFALNGFEILVVSVVRSRVSNFVRVVLRNVSVRNYNHTYLRIVYVRSAAYDRIVNRSRNVYGKSDTRTIGNPYGSPRDRRKFGNRFAVRFRGIRIKPEKNRDARTHNKRNR